MESVAKKRKTDDAGIAGGEQGGIISSEQQSRGSSTPSFLRNYRGTKLRGTLAAWGREKNKADEIFNRLMAFARKVRRVSPTREDLDAIRKMLENEPMGSRDFYFGFDLTELQNWLKKDEDTLHKSRAHWVAQLPNIFGDACRNPINQVYNRLGEIRADLKGYAAFSNKTEMGTRTMEQEKADAVSEEQYAKMMQGLYIPSPSKDEQNLQKFLHDSRLIEPWWPRRNPKHDKLVQFSKFWCELVQKSTKKNATFFATAADSQPTVNAILHWETQGSKSTNLVFPNDESAEKNAVQPILGALVSVLSQIRDDKTGSQGREQSTNGSRRRNVDYESSPLNPFTGVLLNQEMALLKEVKNVRRKGEGARQMHDQVSKQSCGHQAKRALVAFDVGDVGIDSRSIGVIMTPVYMQVISLRLEGMGTTDARLTFERTPLLPLVNKAAFDALVRDEEDKKYLEPLLFPGLDDFSSASDPPTGMKYLWELLHSSDEDLGVLFFHGAKQTATFQSEDSVEYAIGELIGSGSQGLVYAIASDQNLVLKASVVGEIRYLEREFTALQTLAKGGPCSNIPKLHACGDIRYRIRETIATVPAILMSPKGVPALQYISLLPNEKKPRALFSLWSDVSKALTLAHKHNIYHLDVAPRNIVFDSSQFVLIDWGCAACANDIVHGFRGSLPYAHAAVHAKANTVTWKPRDVHDIASLMFTVCALVEENSVPWPGFSARLDQGNQAFENRRDITQKKLVGLLRDYQGCSGEQIMIHGMDVSAVRAAHFESKIKSHLENA